VWSEYLMERR